MRRYATKRRDRYRKRQRIESFWLSVSLTAGCYKDFSVLHLERRLSAWRQCRAISFQKASWSKNRYDSDRCAFGQEFRLITRTTVQGVQALHPLSIGNDIVFHSYEQRQNVKIVVILIKWIIVHNPSHF